MYINVYSHTQHTLLRSTIACQLGSTSSIGHHQAIIQGHKCIQKLRNTRYEISPVYIEIFLKMYIKYMPVPVAARSKASVCGRSPAEIVGSNPTGNMDVFLL